MQSYKEKNNQLHKYIEGQKDAIKKKDTAIDNLLIKMDSLADSNQAKSNEILTLKSEMKHLQERVHFCIGVSLTFCHSVLNSLILLRGTTKLLLSTLSRVTRAVWTT